MAFVGGSGKFALELEGKFAGFLDEVDGGPAHYAVLGPAVGQPGIRQLDVLEPEAISIVCGAGMSKEFYDYVARSSTFARGAPPMTGAILAIDADGRIVSRLDWQYALITEITFPALDAAAKNKAGLRIKILPEALKTRDGSGNAVAFGRLPAKAWLTSHFSLRIDGLEDACSRVSRIESLRLGTSVKKFFSGANRNSELLAGNSYLDDLKITLPEPSAKRFEDWQRSFIDRSSSAAPKNGTLNLLTPNLSSTLFTLSFTQLTPESVSVLSGRPGAEIRTAKVTMTALSIKFAASSGAS